MKPGAPSYTFYTSRLGEILLASDGERLTRIHFMDGKHVPEIADSWHRDARPFVGIHAELDAYFSGQLTAFTTPIKLEGTPFQQRVWAALRTIPYGETWSYARLATTLGHAQAVRAVAAANGRNPLSIIIPCHRVIGSSGKLVGYAGGLDRKRQLLELEQGHDLSLHSLRAS
jgi:methylated-DNA-[protein]-cysteine S-methyltransferase